MIIIDIDYLPAYDTVYQYAFMGPAEWRDTVRTRELTRLCSSTHKPHPLSPTTTSNFLTILMIPLNSHQRQPTFDVTFFR